MKYTKEDLDLMNAILQEDRDTFISAFSSGASLISSTTGRPRFSSNPPIQAMIEFGLATENNGINREIAVEILSLKLSPTQLQVMATYKESGLIQILNDGELDFKPPKYRL